MALSFIEGNEAIAYGAMAAGCRFFAGYPITPATTIFNYIHRLLPPQGGICLQGEDEIASIGYCLGASMAGHKAMTATSGPGLSLMSENISFAIGSEIPVVIVNVQRLGPATGSATRGADGDIQFMRWGNSGGLPLIVLAPVDARDCYVLTVHAFNLAEKYRCPVVIASNKEVGQTREGIDLKGTAIPRIVDRALWDDPSSFLPFKAKNASPPGFLPIGGSTIVRQTSSTHGPDGFITTDSREIDSYVKRLGKKLTSAVDTFSLYDYYPAGDYHAKLVITYGVSARAVKEAILALERNGSNPVSLLVLKTLWPIPERLIREKAESASDVLVVEMNLGQYYTEIQRLIPGKPVNIFKRMDGNLITVAEIREAIAA